MFSHFSAFALQFLPTKLTRQLRELYASTLILELASNTVFLFGPIFLYQIGYSIPEILLINLSIYIPYFFALPLGAKAALHFGFERMIIASSFFKIGTYLSLIGLQSSPLFLFPLVLSNLIQRSLYWPSFHYDFALSGQDQEGGREVTGSEILKLTLAAIGPLVGGLILYLSNFSTLYIVASVLVLVSNVPLMMTREHIRPEPFSYGDAFRRFVNPDKRRLVTSFFGYGEEVILQLLWPLFMFIFAVNQFLSLGAIVAATTFLSVVTLLYVGRLVDQKNKRSVLKIAAIFHSLFWLLRLFLTGVGGVFMADGLSRLSRRTITIPQMSILYERARHRQHAMATSTLFIMGVIIGKILVMLLVIAYFLLFPVSVAWLLTFITAAIFSLLYLLL